MNKELIDGIREVLKKDKRILFAYLYGSILDDCEYHDMDIAVYGCADVSPHELSADLKVALYRRTGLPPDVFDVRVINDILDKGNLFSLVYLKNVFSKNMLLVDRSRSARALFIERYGMKFRECEGLIAEVLS
ncbi:MAG: nucleotidyltransferase domain-containing protein [Syntrophaceae bacterium]